MRIGWLSTGRDAAARTLLAETLRRAQRDRLPFELGIVFCDREPGESEQSDLFLRLVYEHGLGAMTLSSAASWRRWREENLGAAGDDPARRREARTAWRDTYHETVVELLEPFAADVLVLAGYMLIVSPAMCARYPMLNLHPALPDGPTGMWQEVIWELLRTDATATGALINLVTPELDRGPIVASCSFPIAGPTWDPLWEDYHRKVAEVGARAVAESEGETEPLFARIRREGERREIPLLYQTVKQFVMGTLRLDGGRVSSGSETLPLDLTPAVEDDLRLTEEAGKA
jgi:phosphoribosylglycinamide formyltransferase-1